MIHRYISDKHVSFSAKNQRQEEGELKNLNVVGIVKEENSNNNGVVTNINNDIKNTN